MNIVHGEVNTAGVCVPLLDVGEGCRCRASSVRPPNSDGCEQRRRGCVAPVSSRTVARAWPAWALFPRYSRCVCLISVVSG